MAGATCRASSRAQGDLNARECLAFIQIGTYTPDMDVAIQTDLPAFTGDPAERRRLGGPAIRTFARLADAWGLSERERLRVLGQPGRSTYYAWLERAVAGEAVAPPLDVLFRISAILGIHKALVILFESEAERLDWLRRPHGALAFGGLPPLAHVIDGTPDGPMRVRRFLDAARGGIFMEPNAADAEETDLVLL